jgi:hypothetical protein
MIPSDEKLATGSTQFRDGAGSAVRITDLEDGTARIEITRTLPWPDLLRLVQLIEDSEFGPLRKQ